MRDHALEVKPVALGQGVPDVLVEPAVEDVGACAFAEESVGQGLAHFLDQHRGQEL